MFFWHVADVYAAMSKRYGMITAYGDAETKRKALEGGAEALFTKPIDFRSLRSEIDARVERAA